MRSWIELNREALCNNFRLFEREIGSSTVVPVLKANAYGHGLVQIFEILKQLSPKWIGVNYLYEAEELRTLGFLGRVLVVGPMAPVDLNRAKDLDLDIVLGSSELLTAWVGLKYRPRVHIKFDTGMGRQGFAPSDAPSIAEALNSFKSDAVGICSHFANVEDVSDDRYARQQLALFGYARKCFIEAGYTLLSHMAASSSAMNLPESRFELARIGISLFGIWPSKITKLSFLQSHGYSFGLKEVLSWKTEIVQTKVVSKGAFIGYGCTFRANHDMRIAVLPVGYFEGYPRLIGNGGGYVLVKGRRCPIVGRICMNMMMVDISHIGDLPLGQTVTLIGSDREEVLDSGQLGDWAQTINYEIVSRLNPLIPKRIT